VAVEAIMTLFFLSPKNLLIMSLPMAAIEFIRHGKSGDTLPTNAQQDLRLLGDFCQFLLFFCFY
jgi:hypothetical protein